MILNILVTNMFALLAFLEFESSRVVEDLKRRAAVNALFYHFNY